VNQPLVLVTAPKASQRTQELLRAAGMDLACATARGIAVMVTTGAAFRAGETGANNIICYLRGEIHDPANFINPAVFKTGARGPGTGNR
jgi:hypothetical protein